MFRLKKKHQGIFLGALLILSSLAFALLSGDRYNEPAQNTAPQENKPEFVGTWNNLPIYKQPTSENQSIFYLQVFQGYNIVFRADPREAEKVESPSSSQIYSTLYSASRVYSVFDPEFSSNVSIAFTELAKFLSNRPFDVVFGTSEPYVDEHNNTFDHKSPFNTTEDEAVIYMTISNSTQIELVNRTIIISGTDMWDLAKAAAKLELILLRLV